MRTWEVSRAEATPAFLEGKLLLREAPGRDGPVRKGTPLTAPEVGRLLEGTWTALHVAELEADEVHEVPAGERIARSVAGSDVDVGRFAGGYWPITSRGRGLLQVDVPRLLKVNGVDGVAVCTLLDGQVVDAGELLARVKVVPFALPEALVAAAETVASPGVVSVRVLPERAVAALAVETLSERAAARFEASLAEKVGWLGSRLATVEQVADEPGAIADALRKLRSMEVDLILAAGSKAMDPLDPTTRALEELGGVVERRGVPVFPGTLLWVGRLGSAPVVGLPSCGLFSKATVVDVVLPRLLAGEADDFAGLAALGHGGLLAPEAAYRMPRYRRDGDRGGL